jgi:hypothetical protein
VVELMAGVVNNGPVAMDDPPDGEEYHLRVAPELQVAASWTVPVPQRLPGVVDKTLLLNRMFTGVEATATGPFRQTILHR